MSAAKGIILPSNEQDSADLDGITENTANTSLILSQGTVSGTLQTVTGEVLTVVRHNQVVAASGTDTSILAAVAGKKIRVFDADLDCAGTATVFTFNSKPSGSGTAIAGPYNQAISENKILGYNPHGWFETNVGEGLSATTAAGSNTTVLISYALV